ncbi:MAG: hypothetical protein J6S14_23020 [Clostridia bacterium]|nr:hypothetical protein [Clostridia bacterium]
MTLAGVRVIGDTAQDYLFSKKYTLMSTRDTHFRITRTAEDGTKSVISANVTFCNMSDISGGTTDGSAISVEIRFNGEPYLGDAWSGAAVSYVVTQNLTGCTSSYTGATVVGGTALNATLTADADYTLSDSGVVVTMGGVDITAEVLSSGVISIAAVTGDVVINAVAVPD